jgi:anti-sigma factor RsiW
MKDERDYLLQRKLDGELTAEEKERLAALLDESPGLRQELKRRERLWTLVKANREDSFGPFFASRVMARVSAGTAEDSFAQALAWIFRRVAVVAILLIVALTAYNVSVQQSFGNHRSPIETVLALPPVTLEMSIANINFSDAL